MVPSVDEIYSRRPRVRPTTGQALGLLQHHWREPSRTGTPDVGIAQGVASLVVDDVAPVCPQVTGVSVCAELPAPGIEDDVVAVAARQPTARVERCAEFIGRLWGGQDDPEVGMAIDADERVSRRPAPLIRQGLFDQPRHIRRVEGQALLDLDPVRHPVLRAARRGGGDFKGACAALRNASGGGGGPTRIWVTISTDLHLAVGPLAPDSLFSGRRCGNCSAAARVFGVRRAGDEKRDGSSHGGSRRQRRQAGEPCRGTPTWRAMGTRSSMRGFAPTHRPGTVTARGTRCRRHRWTGRRWSRPRRTSAGH